MPSPYFKTARHTSVTETLDTLSLALSEDPSGTGSYLIFQCAITSPSSDDIATKTDSYCIMDELGGVVYGGVVRATMDKQALHLQLTTRAAQELRLEDTLLTLTIPQENEGQIKSVLQKILTYGNPKQRPTIDWQ